MNRPVCACGHTLDIHAAMVHQCQGLNWMEACKCQRYEARPSTEAKRG